MENDGMENNPISRNVLRKDNSSLDYGKDSGINLHGVLHMYSGNSVASYAENSERQRHVFHALQPLFQAAIEKLRFPQEGPLRIADLGCAIGINTVSDVDFVVKTLRNLWRDGHSNGGGSVAEFQAYFSDLPSNDFNGLFNLLDRPASPYFVAGVPGSFYNVLFPTSTIHICFSVMALHWLSEVPQAIVQKTSPLYNKGRVWLNRGSQDIAEAYSKQSERDLNAFINRRAQEMAPGGVIFLCMMGRPDGWLPTEQVSVGGEFCGQDFEDAWDELVTQGIISSDLRDSFNLPWYFPTAEELRRAVECKTNLLNQFFDPYEQTKRVGSRMCWQPKPLVTVLKPCRISYLDGQVEYNVLGETGPLSTYKGNLQNTHLNDLKAHEQRVRERNRFPV